MNKIFVSGIVLLLFLPLTFALTSLVVGGGSGSSTTNNYYNITNVTGGNITGSGVAGNFSYWTNSTNLASTAARIDSDGDLIINQTLFNISTGQIIIGSPATQFTPTGNAISITGNNNIVLGHTSTAVGENFGAFGWRTTSTIGSIVTKITVNRTNTPTSGDTEVNIYPTYNGVSMQSMSVGRNGGVATQGNLTVSNGNVGIGTTTPTEKLHVIGNVNISTGQIYSNSLARIGLDGSTGAQLTYGTTQLINGGSLTWNFNSVEKDRFTANGDLGLGINAPTQKLHQDSGTAVATYHQFTAGTTTGQTTTDGFQVGITTAGEAQVRQYENLGMSFWTNNQRWMWINTTGQVGIGTTTPTTALTVAGNLDSSQGSLIKLDRGSGENIGYLGAAQNQYMYYSSTGAIRLRTNVTTDQPYNSGITAVHISTEGNVGIGTTTPAQKLDVSGNINASYYYGDGSRLTNITMYNPENQIYKQKIDFESTTAGYTTIWIPTAISSGTAPVSNAFDWNHPGQVNVTLSSGTVGSGYAFQQSNAAALRLTNSSYFYSVFFPQCAASSLNISENRIGYQDVFTSAIVVDGLYMNVSQNSTTDFNFTLTASNNSIVSTGTTFSAPCNAWYSVYTVVNNPQSATAFIYNVNKQLVNTQTVTTNIPTTSGRETSSAVVTYMKGARYTNLGAIVHDYFEIGVNATLVR